MRAIFKLLLIFIWLPLMMALTTVPWLVRWEAARRFLALLTFKGMNRILNIHVTVRGQLSRRRPLLLVSNHNSYVDILVLGAHLPIAFTPKKEIKHWPVIGFCCRLAGCVFVERTPKAVAQTKQEIAERLQKGRVMCVFPEGTTGDGTQLKPFKSSFFSLGEIEGMHIQPAALIYTHRDAQPLNAQGRAEIAWYDDMALLPHLWRLLNFRRIDATLKLLSVLKPPSVATRKALCNQSEAAIKQALEP